MTAFLAGIGLSIAGFFMMCLGIVFCSGLIAILRAATNEALGGLAKILWILASFVPGVGLLYFAFVDRNGLLKFIGWAALILIALTALLGGTAVWNALTLWDEPPALQETSYI